MPIRYVKNLHDDSDTDMVVVVLGGKDVIAHWPDPAMEPDVPHEGSVIGFSNDNPASDGIQEPLVLLAFTNASAVFNLMEMLRQQLYSLGGVDPALEACDEVAEYRQCTDSADWKDAWGRLTRRCEEAVQKCGKRAVPPKDGV